jgi:hypothetical protein
MSFNSKTTASASGKKLKLSGAQCRKLKAARHAEVMKNSQSIKQFLAKSASKPDEDGDISLGNNTNEAYQMIFPARKRCYFHPSHHSVYH